MYPGLIVFNYDSGYGTTRIHDGFNVRYLWLGHEHEYICINA